MNVPKGMVIAYCIAAVHMVVVQDLQGAEREWKRLPSVRESTSRSVVFDHPELERLKTLRDEAARLLKELRTAPRARKLSAIGPLVQKLGELAEDYPDVEPGYQALGWKADLLIWVEDHEGAAETFGQLAIRYADYPEGVKGRLRWAEQLMVMKLPRRAVEVLEAVADADRYRGVPAVSELRREVLTKLVEAQARAGAKDKAEQLLRQIQLKYPKRADEVRSWYENSILAGTLEGAAYESLRGLFEDDRVLAQLAQHAEPYESPRAAATKGGSQAHALPQGAGVRQSTAAELGGAPTVASRRQLTVFHLVWVLTATGVCLMMLTVLRRRSRQRLIHR